MDRFELGAFYALVHFEVGSCRDGHFVLGHFEFESYHDGSFCK
jgi:hypothetical protein